MVSMKGAFANCDMLLRVDFYNCQVPMLTDISEICEDCPNLKEFDVRSTRLDNIITMYKSFAKCYSLETFIHPTATFENVFDMYEVFSRSESLRILEIPNANFASLLHAGKAFYDCYELETVKIDPDVLEMSGIQIPALNIY